MEFISFYPPRHRGVWRYRNDKFVFVNNRSMWAVLAHAGLISISIKIIADNLIVQGNS